MYKTIGLSAQNYANHSKLNGQHDRMDLYDHLMGTSILSMIMIMIRYSNELQKLWGKRLRAGFGYASDLTLIVYFFKSIKWITLCRKEGGVERKVSK